VDRSPPAFHRPPEDDLLLTNRASSTEVAQFPDLFIKLPKQLDSDADKGWRSAETARVLLATVPHPKVPRRPTSHNPTEASLQSAVLMRSSGPEGPSLRTRGAARVAAPKYDNRPTKIDPNEHPRLQGFPPHEDPLPRTGGLDRYEARCSLGFSALQGIPLSRDGPAFTVPPLMGFALRAPKRPSSGPPGSHSRARWALSLSRPPTLMGFVAS
jgi:hypothetical protein